MLRDAWDHGEEDLRERRIADLRAKLRLVARAVEKNLGAARQGLERRALIRLEEAFEDAEDALAAPGGEAGPLQGVLDELEEASHPLAELLMERVAAAAVRGKRVEEVS